MKPIERITDIAKSSGADPGRHDRIVALLEKATSPADRAELADLILSLSRVVDWSADPTLLRDISRSLDTINANFEAERRTFQAALKSTTDLMKRQITKVANESFACGAIAALKKVQEGLATVNDPKDVPVVRSVSGVIDVHVKAWEANRAAGSTVVLKSATPEDDEQAETDAEIRRRGTPVERNVPILKESAAGGVH